MTENRNKTIKLILEKDLETLISYAKQMKENLDYLDVKDSAIRWTIVADKILQQDIKTMKAHLEQMEENLSLLFKD